MSRHPQVINSNDVEAVEMNHGEKFGMKRKRLAAATGAQELGCSLIEVPPGKQAFPHHAHYGNEEAFFIISGEGVCRMGNKSFPIKAGDYISCLRGGEEHAHSIKNTGTVPLVYLGISTANQTDIMVYPDSKKIAMAGGANMHVGLKSARLMKLFKDQPNVDYYLDEE